ncbi:CRISPR-associated helicase/endonuclease Cas3 [Actinoalloteichus hoggarensis]|uniref:CRISPR-associated nuclease/helicase Cas3 n=1 Tax=Actinoalloteichus hoggarensis TaxID=1470176 RepID=A0A221W8T9_9PSEU|nr:CRISPR-associated helicase/endonuclease Cas3 [Actinoalloteichus hoggarensis]ASO22338.1 CRISPR-associated nuclease/helicase Cas3 [Actinoalloteichus hoggarensis]
MELDDDVDPRMARWLGTLWGKSKEKAGGRTNLLIAHLLDTAAVGELIWDHFLAPSTRALLDEVAGGPGRGRRLFAWLCGIHDCGKATPSHQRLWPEGARAVRAAGLTWQESDIARLRWRHDKAGGNILRRYLGDRSAPLWERRHLAWVWPLVAGHHGRFPTEGSLRPSRKSGGHLLGKGEEWQLVQRTLIDVFTRELGYTDVADVQPEVVPPKAVQLHLSGLIVMADWIASDEKHFTGLDDLAVVSIAESRERAATAWTKLGLRGGWGRLSTPEPEFFADRFRREARSSQRLVIEAARSMARPGIMVVEAPMGEGKTKAALAAAEVLAARFGADGVFLGMPTQATSDPMFTEVRAWLAAIDAELPAQVGLLHGRRRFTSEWRRLLATSDGAADADAGFAGVDEFDCDDRYGTVPRDEEPGGHERHLPAEWLLGPKRGLLCPFVVGTIDQLLMAATRTKHVMLRMAGLAGKVVILDEVHAADVYMSRFLAEGLRWLGQAGVPVVLLSATLPPAQRRALVAAYLGGAASREEFGWTEASPADGYPRVTTAWLDEDGETPRGATTSSPSWRADQRVAVEVLAERLPARGDGSAERDRLQRMADEDVLALLTDRLAEGGCALVIRNTVARAQSLYALLRERGWDAEETTLLHARLTTRARAERTERSLRLLGSPAAEGALPRPRRFVLIATQLAEQSFDIDADLLVTDLAPVDLLLQRVGRVHRHEGVIRPGPVRAPAVVVTGFAPAGEGVPELLYASAAIYGRPLLLRSAAEVLRAAGDLPASAEDDTAADGTAGTGSRGWTIPAEVPELVSRVYDGEPSVCPRSWRAAEEAARQEWAADQRRRADSAIPYLLTRQGDGTKSTLEGLHQATSDAGDDQTLGAVVRDGEESVEVILVAHDGSRYRTLSGRALTANGDVAADLVDDVLGATVRLPPRFTAAARELGPLPGWRGDPWLRGARALVLDGTGVAVHDGSPFRAAPRPGGPETGLRHDVALGLVETRHDTRA